MLIETFKTEINVFIGNVAMSLNVTLTNNFQYQDPFIDTVNITQDQRKKSKLPIK